MKIFETSLRAEPRTARNLERFVYFTGIFRFVSEEQAVLVCAGSRNDAGDMRTD